MHQQKEIKYTVCKCISISGDNLKYSYVKNASMAKTKPTVKANGL
jgi:hypothetical protein